MDNEFPPPPDFLMNPNRTMAEDDSVNSEVSNNTFHSVENNGNYMHDSTSGEKLPKTEAEIFMPSSDFAKMGNASQWDMLMNTTNTMSDQTSELRKQSLYLKFDPLAENEAPKDDNTFAFAKPAPPLPVHTLSSRERRQDSDLLVKITPPSKPIAEPEDVGGAGDTETTSEVSVLKEKEFVKPFSPKASDGEEFMDSGVLANAPATEWDMLLGNGSNANASTRWERESLYTKFDPLLKRSTTIGSNAAPAPVLENLHESSEEPPVKLHNVQSPQKYVLSQQNSMIAASPAGNKPDLWSLKDELQKKKELLRKQAEESEKRFQHEMKQRGDALQELNESISHANKDIEEQEKQINSSEKPVKAVKSEIQVVEREITNARSEAQKIAESKVEINEDLRQAEIAFSDLHKKYEQLKALLQNFETNQATLLSRQETLKGKIEGRDIKLRNLQEAAEERMTSIKRDYGALMKNEESELNKIRAQYRKLELHVITLEKDVEQKQIENKKLSALCDDLIKGNGR